MSLKKISTWISVSGVCISVFFILIAGMVVLPEPYSSWAAYIWLAWFAGILGFVYSMGTAKLFLASIKYAAVACIIISIIEAGFYWSSPEDAMESVTMNFNRVAWQGVRFFVLIFVGSFIGIFLAQRLKRSNKS